MRRCFFLLLMLAGVLMVKSQNRQISGYVVDRDTKEPVPQVTIQLLTEKDSAFVAGALSGDDGSFMVKVEKDGRYVVRFTSVGYKREQKNVALKDSANVDLGQVVIGADAIMLKNTTITGQAVRVTVVEDTTIYNAAAYRTPEGSVVEELVKKLPNSQRDCPPVIVPL